MLAALLFFATSFPLTLRGEGIVCRHSDELRRTSEFSVAIDYDAPSATLTGTLREREKKRVRSYMAREKDCPAIRQAFDRFKDLSFRAPAIGTIMLDPPVYECRVKGAGSLTITTFDEESAIAKWVDALHSSLHECERGK